MASKIKDKVAEMGHNIAEGAEKAADVVKEKTGLGTPSKDRDAGLQGIQEHMDVIASCGTKVGVVDRVENGAIKLTKNSSPDGQHHFLPAGWVESVDDSVHLKKNSKETAQNWKTSAADCGCND